MFTRNRPDRDDGRRTSAAGLSGRTSCGEYWLGIGSWLLVAVAFGLFGVKAPTSGIAGLMVLMLVRRAHDFGRSGWWVAPFPIAYLALAGSPPGALLMKAASGLGLLTMTVVFGLWPGDRNENRFGPPSMLLSTMFQRRPQKPSPDFD